MRIEEMITASLDRMTEAWRLGDGLLFAQPFADDSRFVAFDGSIHHGPAEIAAFHQRAFDTVLKGSCLELSVDEMKPLDENIWLVFTRGWHRPGDTPAGKRQSESVNIFVFRVTERAAEVLAFQNTRIRPITDPASAQKWRAFDASWEGEA